MSDKSKPIKEPMLQEILFPLQNEERQTSELRAPNLIAQKVRGLELFWSNESGQVRTFLVSERDDSFQFKKSFKLYGASSVTDCLDFDKSKHFANFTMPSWVRDIDPQTTSFFMFQTQNGHVCVNWNLKSERTFLRSLISQISHTKYAWVQIVWCKFDVSRYLGRLASTIRSAVPSIPKEIQKERTCRENGRLKRERYTVPNPEYHRDFRVHGNKIAQHLTLKASSGDVLVVRGLLCPQISLPDAQITDIDASVPLLVSSVESGGAGGPVGERLIAVYSRDPRHLIDLVRRRIPDPDKMLHDYANEYLSPYRSSPPVFAAVCSDSRACKDRERCCSPCRYHSFNNTDDSNDRTYNGGEKNGNETESRQRRRLHSH